VQGPPGTGKTTTLAAFIQESIRKDPSIKILACAPSNVAVDNLASRVLKLGVSSIVRVGHPTRVSDDLLSHCLDALVDKSDFAASCIEIKKEIQAILDSRRGYAALKPLRKELREREAKSIEEVFRQSNVVFTTCNGAFNLDRKLGIKQNGSTPLFDLCVIDECAQALEMSCWIPILQSARCVLGGDHKQLAATIHSKDAERRGLGKTLFERCFERFHNIEGVDNVLTIQYRMNKVIMDWSNQEFYYNLLHADESVADITLHVPATENCTVNGIDMKSIIESPFVFCDTVGVEGMEEDVSDNTASKSNTGELGIVHTYVNLIHKPGITDDICIVSPYLKQTEMIRNAIANRHKLIEVSTVDSFQGREGDVIIISLVRSNPDHMVGFLADFRRLNVAVTRAKRHVFIVGDSETISNDKILQSLYDYACDYGMVISAQSFVNE
jgi:ATP-dependent RNA/DNA helicase IGHMBP2